MTVELALRGVRAGYGPIEVLHGVDLAVPTGAVTALLGANGAGKSTLLAAVAGLIPLCAGEIRWEGEPVGAMTAHQRAHRGMLLVPERRGIFPDLAVRDNLEIFAGSRRGWEPALDAFPVLDDRLGQVAGSLSGGEQQMLALSRALLRAPRLLLLDELSLGLAPRVTRTLLDVVAGIARDGATVLMVEHHLSDVLRMAEVAYVLTRGQVTFAGEPGELVQPAG